MAPEEKVHLAHKESRLWSAERDVCATASIRGHHLRQLGLELEQLDRGLNRRLRGLKVILAKSHQKDAECILMCTLNFISQYFV